MNNVESLKTLYTKLGGNVEIVENINTTAEMIDSLSELEIGGGNELIVVDLTRYTMPDKEDASYPMGLNSFPSELKTKLLNCENPNNIIFKILVSSSSMGNITGFANCVSIIKNYREKELYFLIRYASWSNTIVDQPIALKFE